MSQKSIETISKKLPSGMFGKRLHEIRTERGVSIQKLSDTLELSRNYISQLENGDGNPSLEVLIQIANFFEISTDELLCDYFEPSVQSKIRADHIAKDLSRLPPYQQKHIETLIKNEIDFLYEMVKK